MRKRLSVVVFLLSLASPAMAQNRVATGIFLGGAMADSVTTWHNLRGGFTEGNPLYAVAENRPMPVVLSMAATDALTLWLAHRYHAQHPKIVTVALIALGGYRGTLAARNYARWHAYATRPVFVPFQ